MKKFMIWTLAVILTIFFGVLFYIYLNPQFGGSVNKSQKEIYAQSKYWDGDKFINMEETKMEIGTKDIPGLLKKQLFGTEGRSPKTNIPLIPFDKEKWNKNKEVAKFIWYGHSALLLQIKGKNYLMDPMLGDDSSPIAPFKTKRFTEGVLEIIDQIPPLEAVFMTHDHYDHLDYASIKKIRNKVNKYYVALGVGRHLESWDVSKEQIIEFDWWDELVDESLKITFVPSRHFSGRGLTDRAKSIWGGWVVEWDEQRIYCTGDGGYGAHFKEIAEKFAPFDWAFVECGQYNKLWHQLHMYPEEAVQTGIDVQAGTTIPIHWGGFALALHNWKDPVERFVAHAIKTQTRYTLPQIGEIVLMGQEPQQNDWYIQYE
jgi:L-ascorbate metabolism protein UlaG (beta-lactamase superfamily)